MTAFRQSLPVLVTSFVNKAGSIGLTLVPMLLVAGAYTSAESSLVMGAIKGSMIVSVVLAGWLGDVAGLRVTVLGAFLCAAVGLAVLPLQGGLWLLLVSGVVAQTGIGAINACLRLLLIRSVERAHQKEALGWLRTVNNLSQVLTYAIASLTAAFGAKILIWFDAATSFVAFIIGRKLLPMPSGVSAPKAVEHGKGSWGLLVVCTFVMLGWNFMYDLYMVGVAGRLQLEQPEDGLRIFAAIMVLNTVLCAAFAVVASRWLSRAVPSLLGAGALTAGGLFCAMAGFQSFALLFLSALLITLGEVAYGVFAQFLLIRSVPPSRRENTIYSAAVLVANIGRLAAGVIAFPRIVHTADFRPAAWLIAAVMLLSWGIVGANASRLSRLAET